MQISELPPLLFSKRPDFPIFCKPFSAKAIREEIGVTMDEINAVHKLAEDENRDLSDEDEKQIDALMATIGTEATDEQPATGLRAKLARAEAVEAERERQATIRMSQTGVLETLPDGSPPETTRAGNRRQIVDAMNFTIPQASRWRTKKLKAFKGEDYSAAEHDKRAYLAGQFYLATIFKNSEAATWCRERGIDVRFNALQQEGDNSLGGFLVPKELERAIIDLREEYGVFRRNARISAMSSNTKDHPKRATGVTAYYVGETDSITDSSKTWSNVQLVAKKLAVLTKVSSELSEDAIINLGDDLTFEIAYAFAKQEDETGFNGDGTGTHGGITGILNALLAGSWVISAAGEVAFSKLTFGTFEAMVAKLPSYAGVMPAWYIHKAGWATSMQRLLNAAGGNTIGTIEGGATGAAFLGYPVRFTNAMNNTLTDQVSTKGLCYFADLRQGVIMGTRRNITIAVSTDRYFEEDNWAIRGTERFDIQVHETGDATNAGAIVGLETPAA